MTLKEIFMGGSGTLVIILTLVQLSPIKIDPWSAVGRGFGRLLKWIGRSLNGDVLSKLDKLEAGQQETKEQLDEHIRVDDERDANARRRNILNFDAELVRGKNYTHEYFVDLLADIDEYERYCEAHPGYKNNRAVLAIANIKRVYAENERSNSFLKA